MRERRRALVAFALLLVAAAWLDRPAPLVSIDADVAGHAPTTAQAAVDLGVLGTFALSWTVQQLK